MGGRAGDAGNVKYRARQNSFWRGVMVMHSDWPERLLVVVPLAQVLQRDWPAAAAAKLGEHLEQATAPVRLEKEPAAQGLGALRVATSQKEPGGQARQAPAPAAGL